MKKKILSICLVAVIAVMAIAGASLAYFTAEDSAENVFTVGNVPLTLPEPNWETTGKVEAEDVYPGEPLAKDLLLQTPARILASFVFLFQILTNSLKSLMVL